jgi:hypothetical protein
MRRKTFTVNTNLPPDDALRRLAQLLESEGVKIDREESGIRSLRTPIPLLNVDPRLYSRRNWVGINPFALLTSVEMKATANSSGTAINVLIDRRRIVMLLALEAIVVFSIAFKAPLLPTLIIAVVLLGICCALLRWAHTLTRFEIRQQLLGVAAPE